MSALESTGTLVLGASGFLGPHLVRAALRAGGPVCAVARRPEALADAVRAATRPASWSALDLERASVEALIEALRPRLVVQAAALSRLDACARDPRRARSLNALLPEQVARACAALGARCVHVSTDLVFGGDAPPGGYREDEPVAPRSRYGATKAEGEARVLDACPGALVVRLPLLAGDSFGRGLGASDALWRALERGERPRLFTDEWRTPLGAAAAAAVLIDVAATDARGVLHVAGAERLSRHELGLRVLGAGGVPEREARRRLVETTRRAAGLASERPADVSLNAARARALLDGALTLDPGELARSARGD